MHAAQVPPPQSLSVSLPFLTLSRQVGAWQTLPVHTLLVQSEPKAQTLPLPQAAQSMPPQSLSVSLPFFTVSTQVGATHTLALGSHTLDEHWAPVTHSTQLPAPSQYRPPFWPQGSSTGSET